MDDSMMVSDGLKINPWRESGGAFPFGTKRRIRISNP